jgi:CSLREA domain-containing protein
VLALWLVSVANGQATTYVVNTANDVDDGTCDVVHCSLREAIDAANAIGGADIITFAISGGGVHTILLDAPLPQIQGVLEIDGFSQPGAQANTNILGGLNAVLQIELRANFPIVPTHESEHVGLEIVGPFVTIKGLAIGGFSRDIRLSAPSGVLMDITIAGNYLGTTPAGDAVHSPQSDIGIELTTSASDLKIGGSTPAARNLISGHTDSGIWFGRPADWSSHVTIAGNLIGTTADGQTSIPNGTGIHLVATAQPIAADLLVIGGTAPEEGNVISGNSIGVDIDRTAGSDIGQTSLTIQENAIGMTADRSAPLGNAAEGIVFRGDSQGIVSKNQIAANGGAGIIVLHDATHAFQGVAISQNAIFGNAGLGIDLDSDGRTANDAGDGDTGPNNLQNYPVLRYANDYGGGTWGVVGALHAEPSTQYTIEIFNNASLNRPGYDGVTPAGTATVTTDANGDASFAFNASASVPASIGDVISATATDPRGFTSEFSSPVMVAAVGFVISGQVTQIGGGPALGGQTIALSGDAADTTTTESGGAYLFMQLAPGNYTVTPTTPYWIFTPSSASVTGLSGDEIFNFEADLPSVQYTVNSEADPGDGVCDVAECTLREAIEASNAHPGPDSIIFNIPGAGVHTIEWSNTAPAITGGLTIDGFTQPGATPNTNATGGLNAVPLIEISGGPWPQSDDGLTVEANHVTIRGLVITGFYNGVHIEAMTTLDDVTVAGNFFGTTADGTESPLCSSAGVFFVRRGTRITIGGTAPADRNLIAGHCDAGIYTALGGVDANDLTIVGNLIGTDITGQAALGNFVGIYHYFTPRPGDRLKIGGSTEAERNVISGNTTVGIDYVNYGPDEDDSLNTIVGNYIGVAADGTSPLGNGAIGVLTEVDGAKLALYANVLAFNGAGAIGVAGLPNPTGHGVTMLGNSIYANASPYLGIDLDGDGRTPNDAGDSDIGANNLQNFPVIVSAQELLTGVAITTELHSRPNETYVIELFTTGGVNRPGRDAKTSLAALTGATDATGLLSLQTLAAGLAPGEFIVATATDALGNTSEISNALAVTPMPVFTLTGTITKAGAPLANVTLILSGTISGLTTTNASGQFQFANVPATGSYVVTPFFVQHTFAPASATFTALAANGVADFVATAPDTNPDPDPEPTIYRQFLTEGATGSFWQTTLSILNASSTATTAELRFMVEGGEIKTTSVPIAGPGYITLDASTVPGLANAAFSTEIVSSTPLVASRSMRWGDGGQLGAHAEQSVSAPRESWYFAEGATSCFSLFYLLQNATAQPAEVDVLYVRRAPEQPVTRHYTLPPFSRYTIGVNGEPGLKYAEVSAHVQVTNGVPILAERAMYSSCYGATWRGGHDAAASPAPATSWFLAEGATGSFFDLYVLIANFEATEATVDVRYLLDTGATVTRPHVIPAHSRVTIDVSSEDPLLKQAAVSTLVTSTNAVPVVVERAQWWPHGAWYEGAASAGATASGVEWQLAGGEVGAPRGASSYLLIANTGDTDGQAQVRLVFEDGTTADLPQPVAIGAHSRTTLSLGEVFATAKNRRFGIIVTSVGANPAPVVVELSVYNNTPWNGGSLFWGAGTNTVGTRVR